LKQAVRSLTADFAAMMRAVHTLQDDAPKLLHDEFALGFCGLASNEALDQALGNIRKGLLSPYSDSAAAGLLRAIRSGIVVRSRIAEDRLMQAVARGVTQYVVLGAGLDSSAYRLGLQKRGVHVFEVDLPAMQEWKRSLVRSQAPELESQVTFVPVNFEREALFEKLALHGFDIRKPTFFTWLGVVWYLTDDAVFSTLRAIAASVSDSEIVFEYPVAAPFVYAEDRPILDVVRQAGAQRGETLRPGFDPTPFADQIKDMGFEVIADLSPEEMQTRYLQSRDDGLRMPGIGHLMNVRRTERS